MILGEKLKKAIEDSGFSTETIAGRIGMSYNNLYRIYKKDSFEIKYLVQVAELLQLPLGHFLNDETLRPLTITGSSNNILQASQVSSNNQSISIGGMSKEDCEDKLKDLQEKYDLARKSLVDKERIIEMLEGKK